MAVQRGRLWPGPEPVPPPPALGRAHLCLVSLEGSGEAGQAGGSESPWGLQLYTCKHWAYLEPGLHLSSPPPAPPGLSSLARASPRGSLALGTSTRGRAD